MFALSRRSNSPSMLKKLRAPAVANCLEFSTVAAQSLGEGRHAIDKINPARLGNFFAE